MTIIPPPNPGHLCRQVWPWSSGGYGDTGHPDGTIWVCPCGRAYVARPCYESYGPTQKWRPIYRWQWWHNNRIREGLHI